MSAASKWVCLHSAFFQIGYPGFANFGLRVFGHLLASNQDFSDADAA